MYELFDDSFPINMLIDEFVVINGLDIGTIVAINYNAFKQYEFVIRTNNRTKETVTRTDLENFRFLAVDNEDSEFTSQLPLAEFKEHFVKATQEDYKPGSFDQLAESVVFYIRLKKYQAYKTVTLEYTNLSDNCLQTLDYVLRNLKCKFTKTQTETYNSETNIHDNIVKYTITL